MALSGSVAAGSKSTARRARSFRRMASPELALSLIGICRILPSTHHPLDVCNLTANRAGVMTNGGHHTPSIAPSARRRNLGGSRLWTLGADADIICVTEHRGAGLALQWVTR